MIPERDGRRTPQCDGVEFDDVYRSVRRALVARCGVEAGVEAAAEAMVWALANPDRMATLDNPAGYLYRVGLSSTRRDRRARARQARSLFEPVASPEEPLDGELIAALTRIRKDQRVAVVLVHAYGYSYREVATLVGITESAVTNHVHRGLRRLRELLEDRS